MTSYRSVVLLEVGDRVGLAEAVDLERPFVCGRPQEAKPFPRRSGGGIAGADEASVAVAGAVADGAGVVRGVGSDAGDSVSRTDGAVDG